MNIRYLLAIVGLAIGFAVPNFSPRESSYPCRAQPLQSIPAGPALVQQLELIDQKF
jgi:hypothetical protein